MKIGCVVKAAGQSARFGGNKLLYPLKGTPLLAHVLRQIPRERLQKLVVVVRDPAVAALCQEEGAPCLCYPGGPQSETIRLGIQEMDGMDGCMFVMGDQPLCRRESMERLLDAFVQEPELVFRLAFQGQAGSPVVFPRRFFPQLAGLSGEQGGMAVLRGREGQVRLVEAGGPAELRDCDTREDARMLTRL